MVKRDKGVFRKSPEMIIYLSLRNPESSHVFKTPFVLMNAKVYCLENEQSAIADALSLTCEIRFYSIF